MGNDGAASPSRCSVVGIAGPSGCGKSTLASALVASLNDISEVEATLFPEGTQYFRAPKTKSYRDANPHSETPSFIHWDRYVTDLQYSIEFSKHKHQTVQENNREGKKGTEAPTSAITTTIWIVDHFLLLHDPRVVEVLDALIFLDPCIDIDDDLSAKVLPIDGRHDDKYIPSTTPLSTLDARNECRERRVRRDPNRAPAEQDYLRQYYDSYVWPAYLFYTHGPARQYLRRHPTQTLQINGLESSKLQVLSQALEFMKERISPCQR